MKKEETQLKKDIGDKLFNSLSKKDKDFIIETDGSVDVGVKITKDFDLILKDN